MFQHQDPSAKQQSSKASLGWLLLIINSFAVSVEVFLHRGFGERYLGLQALAVVFVVPFFTLFWPQYDVMPLMWFLAAYLFMSIVARMDVLFRRRRGVPQEHTMYTGVPRLMRFTGRLSERTIKSIVEPLIVFVVGILTMPISEPLGAYLAVAAACLLASGQLNIGYERRRSLDMHDACIDQRQIAERFREMRGDQF